MDKLYITHYFYPGTDPWKNIMLLPEEEAFRKAKELADAHPDTTSFGRFADFENYYPARKKADVFVREKFLKLGGKPVWKIVFLVLGAVAVLCVAGMIAQVSEHNGQANRMILVIDKSAAHYSSASVKKSLKGSYVKNVKVKKSKVKKFKKYFKKNPGRSVTLKSMDINNTLKKS